MGAIRSAPRDPPARNWLSVALVLGLLVVGGAMADAVPGARPNPAPIPAATSSHPALDLAALGAGRFPVILDRPASPAVTNPITFDPKEPAPMGIGDFGVGPGLTAYEYNTSELMGNFTWTSQTISNTSLGKAAEDLYSVQLNAFTTFTDSGKAYTWWIQDVATMNTNTRLLQMMDCVWNATTSSATVPTTGTLTGNGSVSGGVYSDDSTTVPGGNNVTGASSSFALVIISKEDSSGVPEVLLEYQDSLTHGKVLPFDTVVFSFAKHTTSDTNFEVNGNKLNVWGYGTDAELMVGGPYNGDFTLAHNPTHLNMQLYRWNGHNFEAPPDTYNFGSETAESISNISTAFTSDGFGIPSDTLYNGTGHQATTAALYTQNQVGALSLNAAGWTGGTVSIDSALTPFVGDEAWMTLVPGTYQVWANSSSLHDDLGACTITAGGNLSISVTSTCSSTPGPVTISSFTATPNPVAVNSATSIAVAASGGLGPLSYAYTGLPSGCSSANQSTLSCTPTASGTFPVLVTVHDPAGSSAQSNLSLMVTSSTPTTLQISSFTATPNPVTVNSSTTLDAVASGGLGPLTYAYTGLPTGCSSSNASALLCKPSVHGNFSVTVQVHDSEKVPQTVSDALTLQVSPSTPPPVVLTSYVAWPDPVRVGEETRLYTNTTGGYGWMVYAYTGLPPGCDSEINATLPCTPTVPGTYQVAVEAWPSGSSDWVYGNLTLTVEPASPLSVSLTADPTDVVLGGSVNLTTVVAGGFGAFVYAYTGLPSSCSNDSVAVLRCTPTALGSFTVQVQVRDAAGDVQAQTATFDVVLPAGPSGATLTADPATVAVGHDLTLSVAVDGGYGALGYAYAGLPSGCTNSSAASLSCQPSAAGWYNVTVTVRDGAGRTDSARATVDVTSSSTGAPAQAQGSSGLSSTDWLLLALVIAAVAAVVLVVVVRSRRAPPPAAYEEPPGEGYFEPPPG